MRMPRWGGRTLGAPAKRDPPPSRQIPGCSCPTGPRSSGGSAGGPRSRSSGGDVPLGAPDQEAACWGL
eukprot:14449307-Alexandrium_andersonii.AAC.1